MLGLSHVLLHVGLCGAVSRLAPQTMVAMHVKATFPVRSEAPDTAMDKTFRLERGDDPDTTAEFDLPRGIYKLRLDVPKYKCTDTDYVEIMADHNRSITETLHDGTAPQPVPNTLFDGTAPTAFFYAKPTYVLFDKSVTCNGPVGTPLTPHISVENDPDAYYVSLYSDPSLEARGSVVVALRLRTPTGLYHYVRVPIQFPAHWSGWPASVGFPVTEDNLDDLTTDKTDTLLCPKIWGTGVH
jgi:hypothetical protein